jgi:hypothetical protein
MGVVNGEHRYQACRDPECQRFACRVYQEGEQTGFDRGHAVGEAEGYASGLADGLAACPGPHGSG